MLNKKRRNLFLIVFLFGIFLLNEKNAFSFFKENQLLDIIEGVKKQEIEIKNWSMLIKKPIVQTKSKIEINKKIEQIKTEQKGFTWSIEPSQGKHYKMIGMRKNFTGNVSERILIIFYPVENNRYNLSVTYAVLGKGWNRNEWNRISKEYESEMNRFSVFYAVEGVKKLKEPLKTEATKLLNRFSANTVEGLYEKNFISGSAYNKIWKSKIPLGNQKFMNLHISYRTSNGNNNDTTVTIGTPIITSEY